MPVAVAESKRTAGSGEGRREGGRSDDKEREENKEDGYYGQ